MKWKDVTSYSYGEKDGVPSSWQLQTKEMTINVTRSPRYFGIDVWVVYVTGAVSLEERALKSKDIEKAKREAIAYVQKRVLTLFKSIQHL